MALDRLVRRRLDAGLAGNAGRSLAHNRRAHLARESEITPSSPKVRRELFEIVLQEQILFAAR